jgi:hypothetical protein
VPTSCKIVDDSFTAPQTEQKKAHTPKDVSPQNTKILGRQEGLVMGKR